MNKYFIQFIAAASCLLIAVIFGVVFFQNRAFGAWGDDSPGYIYEAAQFFQGKSHIQQRDLVKKGFEYFSDPEVVRFLMPFHSKPLNREGWIASKYPIGAGLMMAALGKLAGNDAGFYYVVPLCALACLVLLFWLAYYVLEPWSTPVRILVASLSMILLACSSVFYEYALSQPMRELPSMVFILLAFLCLILAKRYPRSFWPMILCAGASYGLSINIRETGAVLAPALLIAFLGILPEKRKKLKRMIFPFCAMVCMGAIFLAPFVWNSYQISKHSTSFETGDAKIMVTSNIDHVESIKFSNMFANNGRFRSGEGSLPHFFTVIQDMLALPLFLTALLIGIWTFTKRQWSFGLAFAWSAASVILFFSLWINPYARYILPAFPFLCFFIALGIVTSIRFWMNLGTSSRIRFAAGMLGTAVVMVYLIPSFSLLYENYTNPTPRNKVVTREDFHQIKMLPGFLSPDQPMFVMTGNYMFGMGEMIEGHAQIPYVYLDEKRVALPDAISFIDKEIDPAYTLYLWMDTTTPAETRAVLTNHWQLELVKTQSYSFTPSVEIYRINGLITQ